MFDGTYLAVPEAFRDAGSFLDYAELHYLPLLDRVSEEGHEVTRDEARLLAMLHDDITSMVSQEGNA